MQTDNARITRPKGFRSIVPKAVSLTTLTVMKEAPSEIALPWTYEATVSEVDLAAWMLDNLPLVEEHLAKEGAVLFRRCPIHSIEQFQHVAGRITPNLMDYVERSTPRKKLSGHIYTSTEYPQDQCIQMHNENSYASSWPMKLWFCCIRPPETGGQTPLADSRTVLATINPKVRDRFIEKQIMYVRNYGNGLGLPWQEVFQTTNPHKVEAYCTKSGIEFEWLGDSRLRTRQVRPAVAIHPRTGDNLWFNQAHLFHVSNLPPAVRAALERVCSDGAYPRHACYGDGKEIEPEALEEIRDAYQRATSCFNWQRGDVLLVDNMLTAHGRMPYTGQRDIAVAMAEPSASGN